MFIPVMDKESGGREVLVNMDFVSMVLVSNEGFAVFLFEAKETELLYETLTPYEEVKKMLLDWQGTEIRVEVDEV